VANDNPANWFVETTSYNGIDFGTPGAPSASLPLTASTASTSTAPALSSSELEATAQAALTLWRLPDTVTFALADLGDGELAVTQGNTIYVDRDAAGYGWFVDATPFNDAEFRARAGSAAGKMDLLTVLMHELGHVAGLDHASGLPLMQEQLDPGVRYTLESAPRAPARPAPVVDWDGGSDAAFGRRGWPLMAQHQAGSEFADLLQRLNRGKGRIA
jgi:hypothetical protein